MSSPRLAIPDSPQQRHQLQAETEIATKSEDLSIAEQYDALQLRDEMVVIARGKRSAGSTIALKQSEAGTDYHFSLLQHELLESVALPPAIEPFTAFRGSRSSKAPVQQIRVRDKSGVKVIPVSPHPAGIHSGGTDLMLPLVDSSFPILRVIDHMKIADRPAVVVTFSPVRRVRYPTYTPVRFLPFRVSTLATQCKSESDWR